MGPKRWQDWGNALLGAWAIIAPWALGFADSSTAAARTAWTFGAAIVVLSLIAVYMPRTWEEGLNTLLGLCLLISPWASSYADIPKPAANAVATGAVVIALGVWAMLRDTRVQKWWHERHPAR